MSNCIEAIKKILIQIIYQST